MSRRPPQMSPMLVVLNVPGADGETTDYVILVWDGASAEATVITGDERSFDEHSREMGDFCEQHQWQPVPAVTNTHEMALYDVRESLEETVLAGDRRYCGERLFLAPMRRVTIDRFVFN